MYGGVPSVTRTVPERRRSQLVSIDRGRITQVGDGDSGKELGGKGSEEVRNQNTSISW